MCQPRLAVTRFSVPAKCHYGRPWKQCTIAALPCKDYLINRIISPSILSHFLWRCQKGARKQPIYLLWKSAIPMCSHLNHNEKKMEVCFCAKSRSLRLILRVFIAWLLYFAVNVPPVLWFFDIRHMKIHIFYRLLLTQDRFGRWTQLLYINLILIVKGMSISFCWGYLMLIKN